VIANLEAETHLFHIKRFGVALIGLLLLRLLVVVFAPVNYFGDRWIGIWRDFDKVELLLFCQTQSFATAQYAELLAVLIDYPKLWSPNGTIQASASTDTDSPLCIFNLGIVPDHTTEVKQVPFGPWGQGMNPHVLDVVVGVRPILQSFGNMLCLDRS